MESSRLERIAPLTGIAAVVLAIVSAVTLNRWDYLPGGSDLASYFDDKSVQVMVGGYVGAVAAFALIWFAGSVRKALLALDGQDARLTSLAFGGTVVAGTIFAVGYATVVAAGARGGSSGGIDSATGVALYDLYATVVATGAAVGLAVLLLAFGLVVLRRGGYPRWLGWLSVVLAVGSLTPLSYVFVGVDMLWIAVVSVWIYRNQA